MATKKVVLRYRAKDGHFLTEMNIPYHTAKEMPVGMPFELNMPDGVQKCMLVAKEEAKDALYLDYRSRPI